MRRMYDDKGVKLAANTPIEVPAGTNPDDLIEAGTYKVKNVDINGKNYDGTIVVVPWDSLYFRQVFYTIDNPDPNPIFTRVRVNQTHPWKEWEEVEKMPVKRYIIQTTFPYPTANNLEYYDIEAISDTYEGTKFKEEMSEIIAAGKKTKIILDFKISNNEITHFTFCTDFDSSGFVDSSGLTVETNSGVFALTHLNADKSEPTGWLLSVYNTGINAY